VDWLARYGGEEFVVVVPETDIIEASMVAERLRSLISQEIIKGPEKDVHITASFGVTGFNPDTPEERIS
jgi:diguanylate cyclase (GGDEF)-like protein